MISLPLTEGQIPSAGLFADFESNIISHSASQSGQCLIEVKNLSPGGICSASCLVYIPRNCAISSFGVAFVGFQTVAYHPPRLDVYDTWQRVEVQSLIPHDHSTARLRLEFVSDDDVHILSSAWKLWSSEASRKARSLAIRNLDSLLKQNDEEAIPQNVQKLEEINVGQRVRIPNIEYGSISLPDFPIVQYPKDSWSASDFDQGAECIYEVTNAIVHGEQGLIELDNYTLLESIRLVSFDGHSPFSRSEGSVFVPDRKSSISVHCAVHLCSGYPGGRNYAHWLVDIMPALAMCLYRKGLNDAILLIPEPRFEWQNEILNLLPELKSKSIYLSADSVVRADKLLLCSHLLKDPGHFPSQAVTLFSREIKRRLSVADIKPSRQIYVSRKDSFARRLLNEDDLISLLSKFGFEIITLSGLSFSEQVRVFSEASIIVAAHGAGLANAMFCSPGAKLLELFVDNYVQWSMRRLLSLMPIRYGCVVGKEVGFNIGQHGKVWEIGLAEVERAVVAMLIDK